MKIELLSTKITVAPERAPQLSYGLAILSFETDTRSAAQINMRLILGHKIEIGRYGITPYSGERPGLLLTDRPLLLTATATGWSLSMP